ncbi:hypothetical protein AOQ84DRAFT_22892, partial [Glonium stellatum]
MLNCHAYPRRCLRWLQRDVPVAYSSSLRRSVAASSTLFTVQRQQRLFNVSLGRDSSQSVRASPTPFQDEAIKKRGDPWKTSAQALERRKVAGQFLKRRSTIQDQEKPTFERRDPNIDPDTYALRLRELKYLQDPVRLADFVRDKLKRGQQKETLDLVRLASKEMECTVAWNHLIDDRLAKEQISIAMKLYNEMKKRAQIPDSYTYLILLRGMAINAHQSNALMHAMAIYHSMSAPNSRIPPSIMHTNAMLKVCARANNMDALWGVASKIPERGPGAANNLTFTTIINAIRQNLLVETPVGLGDREIAARKEEAVVQGRRIWEDVIGKWRAGDLFIDGQLVNTMGRLLLVGSRPRDWDDILSLVEQTMNIPRLVPRLGSEARTAAKLPTIRAPDVPPEYRGPDEHDMPGAATRRGDEFLPVVSKTVGNNNSNGLVFARPSNGTLSLVIEACLKTAARQAPTNYWTLLTDPHTYALQPDLENVHMLLRAHRAARASAA